jgi:hypothetical protein
MHHPEGGLRCSGVLGIVSAYLRERLHEHVCPPVGAGMTDTERGVAIITRPRAGDIGNVRMRSA